MWIVSLLVTVGVYYGARRLYERWPRLWLSPIFVSPVVLILLLEVSRTSYSTYMEGAQWLTFWLGPATVALAVQMYRQAHLLRRYGLEIGVGVVLGAVVSLVTSVVPGRWLGLNLATVVSLAPRSVTTPIAMGMATTWGGDPTLAAAFVMMTAILGLAIGPLVIRVAGIRTAVGKGALLGMGAHGAGTARAFEYGQEEGAVAGVAMMLAAGLTLVLLPLVFG